MRMSVSETMAACQARGDIRAFAEVLVESATQDSRAAGPGALFCCLPGSRADGHDFAVRAVEQGASAVLAARELPGLSGKAPVLVVEDVQRAMGLLARHWRRRVRPVVAALSGSAGKTTAKEMLASITTVMGPSIKNPGNFNNQLGLPLSMLAAGAEHRTWVLELGISRVGDMEELAGICEPDLAVVHNVGPAHLEGLGDLRGVARAKAALLGFVGESGTALANKDYPELWAEAKKANPRVKAMSTRDPSAENFCTYKGCSANGMGVYSLMLEGSPLEVSLSCQGAHLAENVLAAAAAARALGATGEQIREGLARAEFPKGRFAVRDTGTCVVIDDTYNANPLSMTAAIGAARALCGAGPLALVLGEMGELGKERDQAHEELGRVIAASGCDVVRFKGPSAALVRLGLERSGFAGSFAEVREPSEIAELAAQASSTGGVVLFKGSRSQRMEEFLERFLSDHEEGRR
ncbi:UDP-N-acetylmuramoyl-tripeptide--D-alanyl-D-alanine ligase [Fundidesulfovibrio magnetotacticus]|uniref:UDP-N-acetylmuramoyl-tripeptide--D-alanyl-D-alanine ligase n=1 Tax=Fundidesulfovibrio magnetotacticus TaxID=2730080 RepID=A0A6V8LZ99_9BACT|nr:UDP-N-acetylmuramoyl-tripeptide--D-alanyl-D-alanine ligase [Fundidesulfovibrio magnetotacticus]GFK93555.1 UDP-N-acetylmuramoyl-tripeptide--D-alanyl-D-alanine ligase [Fundidesulfovibrio magnetotacticus]